MGGGGGVHVTVSSVQCGFDGNTDLARSAEPGSETDGGDFVAGVERERFSPGGHDGGVE